MKTNDFLIEYLSLELFKEQLQIVEAKEPVVIAMAGRGFGKTIALIAKAIIESYSHKNHTCLLISASFRQSTEQLGHQIRELLTASKLKTSIRTITEFKITFSNGSVIYILPPNPATIRGFHGKFKGKLQYGITILLDEGCYAQAGDELRKAIEYTTITAPKGKKQLLIASTPTTYDSWVYELWERGKAGDTDIKTFQFSSWKSPFVDKDDLKKAKTNKPDIEYRQEIEGEFVENLSTFFGGLIDKNTIKGALGADPENSFSYACGIDLKRGYGRGKDQSALVLCGKQCRSNLPPIYKVIDVKAWDQHTSSDIGDTLKLLKEQYKLEDIVIEHREAGGLIEYCQANSLSYTLVDPTNCQKDVFSYIHYLLSNNLLLIPKDAEDLISQLKVFKIEMDEAGNIKFGARGKKFHDDLVYALGYAIGIPDKEHRQGFGLARIISTGQSTFGEIAQQNKRLKTRLSASNDPYLNVYGKYDREYLRLPDERESYFF